MDRSRSRLAAERRERLYRSRPFAGGRFRFLLWLFRFELIQNLFLELVNQTLQRFVAIHEQLVELLVIVGDQFLWIYRGCTDQILVFALQQRVDQQNRFGRYDFDQQQAFLGRLNVSQYEVLVLVPIGGQKIASSAFDSVLFELFWMEKKVSISV